MARKKQDQPSLPMVRGLAHETSYKIYSIILFVCGIVLILSYPDINRAGPVGAWLGSALKLFLGVGGYFFLPLSFFMLAIAFFKAFSGKPALTKVIGAILFFLSALGIINLSTESGGMIGNLVSSPLYKLFDSAVSYIILATVFVISFLFIFDSHLPTFRVPFLSRKKDSEMSEDEEDRIDADIRKETAKPVQTDDEPVEEEDVVIKKPLEEKRVKRSLEDEIAIPNQTTLSGKKYVPPPLSLLERDKGKPGVGDIKANANIIKRTLLNFGINVEMDEVSIGPSVTRYALKPAEGVKLARIVALQNDLSLALAAHPIRIEAPIPGKSLVGIEIPNTSKTTVGLATLLSDSEYQDSGKPLLVALGKGVSGMSHFANIAKAPHLLIAGATGSGKSVTIHVLLTSLLYRNSPENLKFIMIDPKRVELTLYNKIPHLLTPVITDAKKAILALKWAAKEMDRRYDILESESVRDIESYHKNILAPAIEKAGGKEGAIIPETMPYIVIVIDELADIMQTYPRELESAIVRLAQMSRAVGIHLMISTQRPSVNVITGLIKANVPSRIALQVASQIDSRTILDMAGAEKLLGAGDMLFMSGDMSKPVRIQSSFISETELKKVVKYLSDNYADEIPQEINISGENHEKNSIFDATLDDAGDEDDDELYEEAREIVIHAGKASTSYLQRKLRIGYARAARLIDMLEERGVIGAGEGSKPREVIAGGATEASSEEPQL